MSKQIQVSPLSGRVYQGRINKAGNAFIGEKDDITGQVFRAITELGLFHGGTIDIVGGDHKWIVTVKKTAPIEGEAT